MTTTEHHEHIEQVVAAIQKRWGTQALRRLERVTADAAGIPTGCAALDRLLGSDGLPRGAVLCLSGSPTSGKTTLALDMLAHTQERGEVAVYMDLTGTLDPEYAEGRGVDLERLLMVWPQPPVLGLDIARDIITSGGAGLIVLDAGRCMPQVGPSEPPHRALRHLSAVLRRSSYALLCLISPASGGLSTALSARADSLLRAERQRWLVNAEGVSGYETRLTVLKNRSGPPGQSAILPVMPGPWRPAP